MATGKAGELFVAEVVGKYFEQTYAGVVYEYSTPAAGVTLTTTGSTVQTFGLVNPQGSNKLVVPIRARIGFVGATGTVTALGWTFQNGLGSGRVAGTSPITAATIVTQINARPFFGVGSATVVYSTITLATAPTLKRWTGISWGAPLATTAAIFPTMIDEFDGDTIVDQGQGLFLGGATGPGAATDITLTWIELPQPPY